MKTLSRVAVGIIAALHVWFFVLETFLWRSTLAQELMKMTATEAAATAVLAGNQGVYNAVFAAGLGGSLVARDETVAYAFARFFLGAAIAVGIYGALSARIVVLFVQVLPSLAALALVVIARHRATPHR